MLSTHRCCFSSTFLPRVSVNNKTSFTKNSHRACVRETWARIQEGAEKFQKSANMTERGKKYDCLGLLRRSVLSFSHTHHILQINNSAALSVRKKSKSPWTVQCSTLHCTVVRCSAKGGGVLSNIQLTRETLFHARTYEC